MAETVAERTHLSETNPEPWHGEGSDPWKGKSKHSTKSLPVRHKWCWRNTGLYEEDKGSEFENRHVTNVLNDLAIQQNFTSGYSPQSSGAAEVNVGIVKQVIRRLLEAASFQVPWWAHAL
eukprot:5554892-Amphidinium_carterae.1